MLQVDITAEGDAAGVVVDAVVVKGSNGYNLYQDPFVPPTEAPPPPPMGSRSAPAQA